MKRYDTKPPSRPKIVHPRGNGAFQIIQFIIDPDANALKRSGGRMNLSVPCRRRTGARDNTG
jgi:hypothetical protein